MPHLVTHRPRVANLASKDENAASHKAWETTNAACYLLGGAAFVAGSVCYFPALSELFAAGSWLYFAGSVLYLLVTGHDLFEVVKYWRTHDTDTFADRIEQITAVSYVGGCMLFTLGSLCFLPSVGATAVGVWCFIAGSALFILGGFINLLQVVEAPSLIYMQLFNLTVAQFIVGSALFIVASIPYLWQLGAAQYAVETFDVAQFLLASVLFFTGAVAIYYRKLVRRRLEDFCRASNLGTMFIHALRSEIEDKAAVAGTKRRQRASRGK